MSRARKHPKNMCPDPSCPESGKQVKLLGGCGNCGTAFVPWRPEYTEPTTMQLANFAVALLKPEWMGDVNTQLLAAMLDADPAIRKFVAEKYRIYQETIYSLDTL